MSDAYRKNITGWLIPVMGYQQSTSELTGIEKVWRELRRWSESTTVVSRPCAWDDDWPALAALIARNSAADPVIRIVAYSWGCGFGAMTLARELQKLNLAVDVMVLADPVYRNPSVPRWLNVRALLNKAWAPSITVPSNVREVHWTRQYNNKPQGHDLQAEDARATRIHEAVVRDLEHGQMDDDPFFETLTREVFGA